MMWAHPRSRGDHSTRVTTQPNGRGSSPLARGPLRSVDDDDTPCGLIPARAGTTLCELSYHQLGGAHPRSRGDHPPILIEPERRGGSSPLARGPHHLSTQAPEPIRLIPARAGTTMWDMMTNSRARAHPRSRGDHITDKALCAVIDGSSPLARGPLPVPSRLQGLHGLIPARAGTTRGESPGDTLFRAHPRSRGDHQSPFTLDALLWGSSPLARGPRHCRFVREYRRGLIPARAGTTRLGVKNDHS